MFVKLHHREMGEGQPFIVLHGLFGYSDNWQSHAKKIAEYYRVILVDLRNHGHSPWSDAFSYELMVEDVIALLDELKISEFTLMGHSMGGKTAMLLAQTYPDRLKKLIVVDMGMKAYSMHHEEILKGLNAIQIAPGLQRSDAEEVLGKFVESAGVKQFLLKNLYRTKDRELAWRMNIPVLEKELPEILRALDQEPEVFVPTLFIRGALSNYIEDGDWKDIENSFPDAVLLTIEQAGHWVHAENSEAFLEAVLSFCLR